MKSILIAVATLVATCTQAYFIGLNGLTLISIPMTIYLGIEGHWKGHKEEGGGMSWNYRQPKRSDFDTLEEYESALAAYERAEDDYADQYVEEYLISKYF